MPDIFRKSSLDKLSSPEQLDKMIVITPPSFWLVLAGAALMIIAALIWSIVGRVPMNVAANGIYINSGGIHSVYAQTSGVVDSVQVTEGQFVNKDDVIAYINSEEIQKKLDEYNNRIANVEAVTVDSVNDYITADNANLINAKAQLVALGNTVEQNQALYDIKSKELREQKKKVDSAELNLKSAEKEYYDSLDMHDSTGAQLTYSETQSDLASYSSYYESSLSSLEQARLTYDQSNARYQAELEKHNTIFSSENANKAELEGRLDEYKQSERESKEALDVYKLDVDSAEKAQQSALAMVYKYGALKAEAGNKAQYAKSDYISGNNATAKDQAYSNISANKYNIALSDYQNQKQILTSLEDTVTQLKVQLESEGKIEEKQKDIIYSQFDATKSSVIDQLNMELNEYKSKHEKNVIRASVSGEVSGINIIEGSLVIEGNEVIQVNQDANGSNTEVVISYVPLVSAKKIVKGMKVLLYPTTVNKQEYGHMEGTVMAVDGYVTSAEELKLQLGNEYLMESFIKDGPVVAVTCEIRKDENTASGYYWSSTKGKEVYLIKGTMFEVSIVTEEKSPISLVIPYIKEKLIIK